jgi:GNAT superfamily N-acetyltransferase
MIRITLARWSDAQRISELLSANAADHGGMLMGRWPVETIQRRIAAEQRIIVAVDDDERLLGVLLTSEKGFEAAPPVLAMLKAWPGRADAYVYGPVCIAAEARGHGVLEALHAKLRTIFRGREAVLFIRADNRRSLGAHLKLGMLEVARFVLDDESFIVLSDESGDLR